MRFTRVEIKNFLSVQEAVLDEAVFTPGVRLIHGVNYDMSADGKESNGSGKSSLLESILWAMSGELSRGKVKEDAVINRAAGKNCSVVVEFEHGGHLYKIKRFRKDDEEHGSGLRWWMDGEEKTSAGSRESQNELEAALPCPPKVFRLAVMVGQGMPDRFLDLSESEKQDVLSNIVDLTMYDTALDRAKNKVSSLTTESAVRRATLDQVRRQIESVRTDILNYQQAVAAYEQRSAAEVAAVGDESRKLEEGEAQARSVVSEATSSIKSAEAELVSRRKELSDVSDVAERESRPAHELRGQILSLQAAQDKMAATPTVCPTCKRPLDNGNLVDHMVELVVEQEEKQARLNGMLSTLHALGERKKAAQTSVDSAERALSGLRDKVRAGEERLRKIEQRRTELASRSSQHEKALSALRAKVDAARDSEAKLLASVQPHEESLAELVKAQKHWEFWKVNIPNLRAAAMEEVLHYLNERLAHYMDVFSGGAMGVSLYQETHGKGSRIKVALSTRSGVYDLCSGGEKRRVDLALYLSLSDLLQTTSGMRCNLLSADEICDGLSPTGVRQFLDLLRTLAEEGRCVFVISHNNHVASQFEFDGTLVVECRSGCSTLRSVS